ncbi:DUF6786 family protein [Flammeovirga pacifica]|uniref:Uncharacterized protein n=1 Tax=Flammeovirga pacifica TaxID=915059 RepID=A0A1S1YZT8_FLAPC|nr:DUF6786 family protein [Flammeovirga pacifica]OHX66520.1 hypothetical protein NH26_09210 [Flammeovirga pacifica]
MNKQLLFLLLSLLFYDCQTPNSDEYITFQDDINFLQKHIDDIEILESGESLIALSPKLQGRVFTTSNKGLQGRSLGYFDKELIATKKAQKNISKIGGESRMWFGPEVGEFSIFFPPNVEQVGENMKVSIGLDTTLFHLSDKKSDQISSSNTMYIQNTFGSSFQLEASRTITILHSLQIEKELGISLDNTCANVGFSTSTTIKNIGNKQWKKESGLLPIWDLGCFHPSKNQWAIVPSSNSKLDTVTNYFTDQKGRVMIKNGVAFYKVDANYLNKMGIPKEDVTPVMGSYSPEMNLLTIVKYSFEENNDDLYVSSEWGSDKNYDGDVMNIFNGEVNPSLDRNWPFFELESFSPAKELIPNDTITHEVQVYHFTGKKDELSKISESVLGVSLFNAPFSN